MKLRIEIRGGPPSMFNPEANLYVIALHPDIGSLDEETGKRLGEKVLSGPMTERNAFDMVEAIRHAGVPDEMLQEPAAPPKEGEEAEPEAALEHDGVELPPEPLMPKPPKQPSDLWIPIGYLVGVGLFVFVVVYFMGLR